MNLLSVLQVERAYELKKIFQCLFQPVCGQERGHFDIINLDIVSFTKVYQERQLFL